MVKQELPKHEKKIGRRKKLKQVNENLQGITNSILWQIVKGVGGSIDIPMSELAATPANATFDVKFDRETNCFVIAAVTPEKKLIEVPRLIV
jgi:hypothetical protein